MGKTKNNFNQIQEAAKKSAIKSIARVLKKQKEFRKLKKLEKIKDEI